MTDLGDITRQFSMEGATHLYSSFPAMLTPADLYRVKDNPTHKAALLGCNIYLIVRRQRIYLKPEGFALNGRTVAGEFLVLREQGMTAVPFVYEISHSSIPDDIPIDDVAVALNGTSLIVLTPEGKQFIAVNVIVAAAKSALEPHDTDLEILYVGQGIGRTGSRTALDRLQSHSKFQQILAETSTHFPEREVLLLLYRFEHGKTIISNGGDFNVEAQASAEQDSAHLDRLRNVRLNRKEVVSLAEAGLINYFKPYYNTLLKTTNFSSKDKLKVLKQLLKKGIAGLVVELCSVNLRSRIGTVHAVPIDLTEIMPVEVLDGRNIEEEDIKERWQEQLKEMAHSHYAKFALTTTQERNTFLHGTTFIGQTEEPWSW
ncbi:hypothetical protein C9383_09325 [Pseudomonas palleroniana]|uniref:Uncharacterized protein n=1 Tax=Pseudomonas palleroniana TaxID=191390 RepID=A0A1H5KQS3_9PSED|nr:hypothetical protein [Pseudomonas palleroniana]KAB0568433.1 hypothetical protein F7R03_07515 [Pseudomonas palleroniana]PTC28732.1 hypothetical protein C9383_09325 [Pseudomonas palleroniana]SEE66308.1 hypothetical protein SAMN04490198_2307 [Pseudomonas palleroniana]